MDVNRSSTMQLDINIDTIKTEITSDNENDSNMFVENIDVTKQICNHIYDDNGNMNGEMVCVKSENDPDTSRSSDDFSYVHEDIVAVEIKVDEDRHNKNKGDYRLTKNFHFDQKLDDYTSNVEDFNRYERYYSDEDDDEDDEDDDYGCEETSTTNEDNHNFDNNFVRNRHCFPYSDVSDGDIMNFLRTRSYYKGDKNAVNIGRQNDFNTIPNNGLVDKQDVLGYLYNTINIPVGRIVKFLVDRYNLTNSEAETIRKLRRRIKNRMYAKNCRIRKMRHMKNLASELLRLRQKKQALCKEKERLFSMKRKIKNKFKILYSFIGEVVGEFQDEFQLFLDDKCKNEDFDKSNLQIDSVDVEENKNEFEQRREFEKRTSMPGLISLHKLAQSRLLDASSNSKIKSVDTDNANNDINNSTSHDPSPSSLSSASSPSASENQSNKQPIEIVMESETVIGSDSAEEVTDNTKGLSCNSKNKLTQQKSFENVAVYPRSCNKRKFSLLFNDDKQSPVELGGRSKYYDVISLSDDEAEELDVDDDSYDDRSETNSNDSFSKYYSSVFKKAYIQKFKQHIPNNSMPNSDEDVANKNLSGIKYATNVTQIESSDKSNNETLKLIEERDFLLTEKRRIEKQYMDLYKHTFQVQSLGVEAGATLLQTYMSYCIQLLNIPTTDSLRSSVE